MISLLVFSAYNRHRVTGSNGSCSEQSLDRVVADRANRDLLFVARSIPDNPGPKHIVHSTD